MCNNGYGDYTKGRHAIFDDMTVDDILNDIKPESDLAVANRLFAAECARLAGTCGYTVDEFENNMREAIEHKLDVADREAAASDFRNTHEEVFTRLKEDL